jgi:hypothetical protein
MLRSLGRQLVTDVSEQAVGPIFKAEAAQEAYTYTLPHNVTTHRTGFQFSATTKVLSMKL